MTLRNLLRSTLLCLLAVGGLSAAGAGEVPDTLLARDVFVKLGIDDLPLLTRFSRLEMLAYFDSDSIHNAKNGRQGTSHLEKVTPGYLSVKVTPESDLKIKILERKNASPLALAIYTVGQDTSGADSELRFFDSDMKALPASRYFKAPSLKDFVRLTPAPKLTLKQISDLLPFVSVAYNVDPDTGNLVASLSYADLVSLEDAALLKESLYPNLTYVWNGKSYRLNKPE